MFVATAVVPAGPSAKMEEALFQLLAGARACLDREGVTLVGGHSSEGADLALGLSVTGEVAPGRIVRKGGLKPTDALILTRPLGTGILFAAAMRARAQGGWIEAALNEMRQSNREAARIVIAHAATRGRPGGRPYRFEGGDRMPAPYGCERRSANLLRTGDP